jgi:hypothetical protein
LGTVCSITNDFGGGVTVSSPMERVLYSREESVCLVASGCVLNAGREDIKKLSVEHFFAGSDVTNAIHQFVKIVATSRSLQEIVVHGETLDQVFTKTLRGPDANCVPRYGRTL